MIRFSSFLLGALTFLTSGGCDGDRSCTLIGCENGAALSVHRVEPWADGEYALDVELRGRQHSCRFTLPLPPAARPNEVSLPEQSLACTPALPASSWPSGATVWRVDRAAPACPAVDAGAEPLCARDHYSLSINIDDSSSDVALRLSLGDTVLLDERRTLDYRTSYPNGPDCGGPCRYVSLTFNVEEP